MLTRPGRHLTRGRRNVGVIQKPVGGLEVRLIAALPGQGAFGCRGAPFRSPLVEEAGGAGLDAQDVHDFYPQTLKVIHAHRGPNTFVSVSDLAGRRA